MTSTTNNMTLLTFICPPLAVYLKHKGANNIKEMVFLATIFTLMLWIPGVLFAYWACFIATKDEDLSSETTINNNINFVKVPKSSQSSLTLHNPTPIHPKANQIISFPITLASVIIHFPEDLNDLQNDLIDNNNNIGIHPKAYMV